MRRFRSLLAAASAMFVAAAALGHEFWVQPSTFRPAVGAMAKVQLLVGDGFPGEGVARDSTRIEKFVIVHPDGTVEDIVGRDGREPAGYIRPKAAGTHVIGYRNKPIGIELEAAKFEAYLREEGLEKIAQRRAATGQTGVPGREKYSRCAKAVLAVGGEAGSGFDRRLGLRLELIPEADLSRAKAGDELPFRLLLDSAPCAGVLVTAFNSERADAKVRARTDEHGLVRLRLATGGVWMVSGVEMFPAAEGSGADWESIWSSLTFELAPEPTPAAEAAK